MKAGQKGPAAARTATASAGAVAPSPLRRDRHGRPVDGEMLVDDMERWPHWGAIDRIARFVRANRRMGGAAARQHLREAVTHARFARAALVAQGWDELDRRVMLAEIALGVAKGIILAPLARSALKAKADRAKGGAKGARSRQKMPSAIELRRRLAELQANGSSLLGAKEALCRQIPCKRQTLNRKLKLN